MARKISNIQELREHALSVLEDLDEGKVDIRGAAVASKLYDNVISSVKAELEYCKLREEVPNIPFLNSKNIIEAEKTLLVENKKLIEIAGKKDESMLDD